MVTKDEIVELVGAKLTRIFHDNFLSTEMLTEAVTGTGYLEANAGELTQHTGITTASSSMLWYNYEIFNPLFSTLLFKTRINDFENVFAFFGFKESNAVPTFAMTESHSGFMIYNGDLYYSTGYTDGVIANQQRVLFEGFDPRNYLLWKIEGSKFFIKQLSVYVPYFDGLQNVVKARDWKVVGENKITTPRNGVHFICMYIKNSTNAERFLRTEHITYAEDYSD